MHKATILSRLVLLLLLFGSTSETAVSRQSQEQLQVHAERVLIRGLTFMQTGYPDKAVATFAEGLKVHPELPVLLASMASAQEAVGDPGSAVFYIDQAIQHDPGNSDLLSQALGLSLSTGDQNRSRELIDLLLSLDSADADLLLHQIIMLSSAGASQLSVDVASEAIVLFPNDVNLLHVSAQTFENAGHLDRAINTVRMIAALSNDPNNDHWLARLLVQVGEFDDAADLFVALLVRDSDDDEALVTLGSIQSALPERNLAHEAGIKADSGFVLGDADVQPTGNTPPDSLNVLRARWNATPDDESAARTLTRFLLRNNEADEAARFAKEHVEANPRHIDMWILAVKAFREAGSPTQSVAVAEDALLLYPGFQPLTMEWILSLAADNQSAEAMQAGRELLDKMDPTDVLRGTLETILSDLSPPQ